MIQILSSVASCINFSLDLVLKLAQLLNRVNTSIFSSFFSVLAWLCTNVSHIFDLAVACGKAFARDTSTFLQHDLVAFFAFLGRLSTTLWTDFVSWAEQLSNFTSRAASWVKIALSIPVELISAVFSVISSVLVLLLEAVRLVVGSFFFFFQLVAFVSQVVLASVWRACLGSFRTLFNLAHACLTACYSSLLSLYAGLAQLGKTLTFGLVSSVKYNFPLDAFLGLCVVALACYVFRRRLGAARRTAWAVAWRARARWAVVWPRAAQLLRLVLSTDGGEFRDGDDDDDLDIHVGDEFDLHPDWNDGESVRSFRT